MRTIPLSRGLFALVDDEDFERLSAIPWHAQKGSKGFYANNNIFSMHRHIMGCSRGDGLVVDHRDGNGLNNQKSNLRVCLQKENSKNKRLTALNTSGYKGVSWNKKAQKWVSSISCEGSNHYLGLYRDIEVAAIAYDIAAVKHHKDFACLNFPQFWPAL